MYTCGTCAYRREVVDAVGGYWPDGRRARVSDHGGGNFGEEAPDEHAAEEAALRSRSRGGGDGGARGGGDRGARGGDRGGFLELATLGDHEVCRGDVAHQDLVSSHNEDVTVATLGDHEVCRGDVAPRDLAA